MVGVGYTFDTLDSKVKNGTAGGEGNGKTVLGYCCFSPGSPLMCLEESICRGLRKKRQSHSDFLAKKKNDKNKRRKNGLFIF